MGDRFVTHIRDVRIWRAASLAMLLAAGLALPHVPAHADMAPPQFAPGGSVGTGGFPTKVRMVAEEVLLTVDDAAEPWTESGYLASDAIAGHVEATFHMRNEGEAPEAFDVWFPLMRFDYPADRAAYDFTLSAGFRAQVDGVEAPIQIIVPDGDSWRAIDAMPEQHVDEAWATWPATFEPGQDVVVHVTYEVRPTGDMPYGTFGYILDTGAGWYGTIGEGTVTVRLPYPVNETNTVLNDDSWWDTSPLPPGPEVSGTDVVWRFSDLEPTEADNVRLTVLTPRVWRELEQARAAAASAPDDGSAQHGLANALTAALMTNRDVGIVRIGNSAALALEADAAFARARELAPDDLEVLLDAIEHQRSSCACLFHFDYPESLQRDIDLAIAMAPDDPRVADYRESRNEEATAIARSSATARPAPTARPESPTRYVPRDPATDTAGPTPDATEPTAGGSGAARRDGPAIGPVLAIGMVLAIALGVLVVGAVWRRRK